jgi:hypothetical protein
MEVLVLNGLSGDELATFELDQASTTVLEIRRLVRAATGIPKKSQRLCIGAACLRGRDILTPIHNKTLTLTLLRIEPRCTQCGESAMKLRACSACLDVLYCGTPCQRLDWRDHRAICKSRPKQSSEP